MIAFLRKGNVAVEPKVNMGLGCLEALTKESLKILRR